MIVMSSEELVKGNFHIIINGRKTEGAKYGETVINPFMKKKKDRGILNEPMIYDRPLLTEDENRKRNFEDLFKRLEALKKVSACTFLLTSTSESLFKRISTLAI